MKGEKGGKKRISRLGLAEMCNVKHHWCQLRNLRPGLSPIHKSRRLGQLAGPMWIESGVVAGPADAGGGWLGWGASCKAQTRLGPGGERGGAGLAWDWRRKQQSKASGGCKATHSGVGS